MQLAEPPKRGFWLLENAADTSLTKAVAKIPEKIDKNARQFLTKTPASIDKNLGWPPC